MTQPLSYLFVPGDRPDRFAKAVASGAHEIILDLEDAVGPATKPDARDNVAAWFSNGGRGMVRINGLDMPFADLDLAMLEGAPQAAVMVPKANFDGLDKVARRLPGRVLVALVETVEGLVTIDAVAACSGVARLAFGNLDFGIDARIPGDGATLDPARFTIAIASRRARLAPPIDGVTPEMGDMDKLNADIARARALGFTAKLCIHPMQVSLVNEGFRPRPEEIDWAKRVLAAISQADGVVQVDGKMVDAPVIARARMFLEIDGQN